MKGIEKKPSAPMLERKRKKKICAYVACVRQAIAKYHYRHGMFSMVVYFGNVSNIHLTSLTHETGSKSV